MLYLVACAADVNWGDERENDDTGPMDRADAVCAAYLDAMNDHAEGTWTGSTSSCDAGDMDEDWRDRTLNQVNMYRFLADLPAVELDDTRNAQAQDCALMMDANGTLSHTPDESWACYTPDGATGAGSSNIASGAAVAAVDMYMQDWGNETTIGHRRWILSNSLGPIGTGSTQSYSCLSVIGGSGDAGKAWMAWPPPGPFPVLASVDSTGWTIQSDSIDLSAATVTVTADGEDQPVTVDALDAGYGSNYAIKLTPDGWTSAGGTTYSVAVDGVSEAIDYDVEMVDCD